MKLSKRVIRHSHKKRLLAVFLSVFMVLFITAYTVPFAVDRGRVALPAALNKVTPSSLSLGNALEGTDETTVIRNGDWRLVYYPETAAVALINDTTGLRVDSNPSNWMDDSLAKGNNRARLRSQVVLRYMDANGEIQYAYSSTGSVSEGTYQAGLSGSEFVVHYLFQETGLEINLAYSIQNGKLAVRVPAGNIVDNPNCRLISFQLLPYLGAASREQEGYLLLPDGHGSLTHFNNGKNSGGPINLSIYCDDQSEILLSSVIDKKTAMFPMYAMVNAKGGKSPGYTLLANAVKGEFGGQITAYVSGRETSYNTAFFTFVHRGNGTVSLLDRTWAEVDISSVTPMTSGASDYEVEYTLLDEGASTLAGVAKAYRSILQNAGAGQIRRSQASLHLNIYQSVRKKKQFAGIPYTTTVPLTTFSQVEDMVDQLQTEGVSRIQAVLKGIDNDGAGYGKIDTKASVSYAVGGEKGLKALSDRDGLTVYPEFNLLELYTNGNGLHRFLDTAVNISYKDIKKYTYKLSTYEKDITKPIRTLVKVECIPGIANALKKSVTAKHITSFSIGCDAGIVYTDLSQNAFGMNRTGDLMKGALQSLSKGMSVTADQPMGYAIPYITAAQSLPMISNGFYASDYTVPLIPLILDGVVDYTLPPVNLAGDMQREILLSIESKSSLLFQTMAADYQEIKDTELNGLYSASFAGWKEKIVASQRYIEDALDGLWDQAITDYTIISKDVRVITYENNETIVINYGKQPYTYGGIKISACSYKRMAKAVLTDHS